MSTTYRQNMNFEEEVRWVAEAVWDMESGACQPQHYAPGTVVRELDGIARLRDVTHLLMATASTKLDKVKSDVKKLKAAETHERKTAVAISKWIITQHQLNAQHIDFAKKNNVTILTLEQFKHRFFNGREYLSKRQRFSFGSARNPLDDSITFPDDAYVNLPMTKTEIIHVRGKNLKITEERRKSIDLNGIERLLRRGEIVILMAPFGSGKSVTTRELFGVLANRFRKTTDPLVPICLNLREHWGQEHFAEILNRHARSIAFSPREDLVVAWRAGLAMILLDGFDEVASQTIVRKDKINFMMEARRTALAGVRDCLTKLPAGAGVFVCGRDHYFDNPREMEHALGVSGKKYTVVRLDEFTEDAANEFLRRNGVETILPDWLPRKPLILSYLIQNNLLEEILQIDASEGYGHAWNSFVDKICLREAELERAVMDAHTVRNVMERLAFSVRSSSSGTGPITGNDLATTYYKETGQHAGEGVLAQLQRLPGLTQRDTDAGARSFVDQDMLWALQGGALARIISNAFDDLGPPPLQALSTQAVDVAAYILKREGATSAMAMAALKRFARESNTQTIQQIIADCFAVALLMVKERNDEESLDGHGIAITNATLGRIDFEEHDIRNVHIQNCLISEIILMPRAIQSGVVFHNCIISRLGGVSDEYGMPKEVFGDGCEVLEFDNMATNNAVLHLDLEPQLKALITVLRKLYRQSGAGRKFSALSRGITQNEVEAYIPPVIDALQSHGFIRVFNNVVHPVRKNSNRVETILSAPSLSEDELVTAIKKL